MTLLTGLCVAVRPQEGESDESPELESPDSAIGESRERPPLASRESEPLQPPLGHVLPRASTPAGLLTLTGLSSMLTNVYTGHLIIPIDFNDMPYHLINISSCLL